MTYRLLTAVIHSVSFIMSLRTAAFTRLLSGCTPSMQQNAVRAETLRYTVSRRFILVSEVCLITNTSCNCNQTSNTFPICILSTALVSCPSFETGRNYTAMWKQLTVHRNSFSDRKQPASAIWRPIGWCCTVKFIVMSLIFYLQQWLCW